MMKFKREDIEIIHVNQKKPIIVGKTIKCCKSIDFFAEMEDIPEEELFWFVECPTFNLFAKLDYDNASKIAFDLLTSYGIEIHEINANEIEYQKSKEPKKQKRLFTFDEKKESIFPFQIITAFKNDFPQFKFKELDTIIVFETQDNNVIVKMTDRQTIEFAKRIMELMDYYVNFHKKEEIESESVRETKSESVRQ